MDDRIKYALRLAQAAEENSDQLPLRMNYGVRHGSNDLKDIGFLGPLRQGEDKVTEYSSERDFQYPSVYEGITPEDLAAVMLHERISAPKYRGDDDMSERLNEAQKKTPFPEDVDDRAYAAAQRRVQEGRSPFYEPGRDPYPKWSPDQEWDEPAVRSYGGEIDAALRLARQMGGPADDEERSRFIREQLDSGEPQLPQYDPEGGVRTAKKLALDAYGMTDIGGLQEALGYMPNPEGGYEKSALQHAREGDYLTGGLLAMGAVVPGAGKLAREIKGVKSVARAIPATTKIEFPRVDPPLLTVHNVKSHRLPMAEKLGGAPVPSIAIINPEHGFSSFGDISFVGSPEMARPNRLNPVFASDVYSPRFPSVEDDGERIFRGYTPSGNRKYAPLTMENVVREMKGNVRGGENYNYGAGNVRASVTPQFKSLKEIQGSRNRVIPKEKFDPLKEQSNNMLFELAEKFHPYSKYSGSGFRHASSFAETLSDVGRGKMSAFAQDYENLPEELKQEAINYLKYLRDMPTEYFEAKPQRAVNYGEFEGALVPIDIIEDVSPALKRLGTRSIIPFNPEEKDAQQRAFELFKTHYFSAGGEVDDALRLAREMGGSADDEDRSRFIREQLDSGEPQMRQYVEEADFPSRASRAVEAADRMAGTVNDLAAKAMYVDAMQSPKGRSAAEIVTAPIPPDPNEVVKQAMEQYRAGDQLGGFETMLAGMPQTGAISPQKLLLENLKKQRPDALKRARQMGFDTNTIYFHGTDQPIESFHPEVYVTKDPEIAEVYARKREYEPVQLDLFKPNPSPNIIPMFAKKKSAELTNPVAQYYKVFDPRHLRSVFAEFNPHHADSTDLLKSKGGEVDDALRLARQMGGEAKDEMIERAEWNPFRGLKIKPPAEKLSSEPDIREYQLKRRAYEFEGAPEPVAPMRKVGVDAPLFGGRKELGELPYNYAGPANTALNTLYGLKTAPLYASEIGAPLARALDAYETAKKIEEEPSSVSSYTAFPKLFRGAGPIGLGAAGVGAAAAMDEDEERRKGGRVNTKIDRDSDWDMSLRRGGRAEDKTMGYKDKQIADALRVAKRMRETNKAPMSKELESYHHSDLRRDLKGEVYNPDIAPRSYGDDVRDWRTRRGVEGHEKGYNPWLDPNNMYTSPTEERHDPEDPMYYISPKDYRKGIYGRTYALASGGRAKFAEGGTADDVGNFVAQVYGAYLGRKPDAAGKNYWSDQLSSGKINPDEFIKVIRSTPESGDNARKFAALTIQSVLGNSPDDASLNYWTQQLQQGVPLSKMEEILKATPDGQRKTRADVSDSFTEILGREPDVEGLDFWTDQVKKGMPLSKLRENLQNTPEARTAQAEQISNLYKDYLGRDPDPEGLQFFQNAVNTGSATLGDVENAFAESPEAQNYARYIGPINSVFDTYLGREPTDQELAQIPRDVDLSRLVQSVSESPESQQYTNRLLDAQEQATGLPRQELALSINLNRRNQRHTPSERAQAPEQAPVNLPTQIYDRARELWDTGNDQLKEWLPGLIGQEGGSAGWNAAAKTSSAKGPFQFITGTWNDQFAKVFGDQLGITARDLGSYTKSGRYVATALGRQIANLRTDTSPDGKALSMALGLTFNQDNADKLRSEGLPVTPENVYSVHFSGNTGLARAAQNNPNASAGSILGRAAVEANRFLSGLPASQVLEKFKRFVTDPNKVAMGNNVISGYQEARGMSPALQTQLSYGEVDPATFKQIQKPTTPTTPTQPTTPTSGVPGMSEYDKALVDYRQKLAEWQKGVDANPAFAPFLQASKPQPPDPAKFGSPSGGNYVPPPTPAPDLSNPYGSTFNPAASTAAPGGGFIAPIGTPSIPGMGGIGSTVPGYYGGSGTSAPSTTGYNASGQNMYVPPPSQLVSPANNTGPNALSGPSWVPSYDAIYSAYPLYQPGAIFGGAGGGPSAPGVSFATSGAPSAATGYSVASGPAPYMGSGSVSFARFQKGGRVVEDALRIARAAGGRSPAWTRKEGQNPEGGLNAKGRASAKAEGSNLKPPAPDPKTDKDAARRKSFCARMKGMKSKLTSSETANDPDSRINKSLRAWNCREYGGVVDDALRIAKGGEVWDKPRPKSLGEPEALSKRQKRSAKAAAKAAGRPWPNLVDNMRAAQRKK